MSSFTLKQFKIRQDKNPMKVGTDSILLGAWANIENTQTALDIGTGTGILTLMLTQRKPTIRITALDITTEIIEEAQLNVSASPWADRIKLICQPLQEYTKNTLQQFDTIISNPPFFTGGGTFDMSKQREHARHTTALPYSDLLLGVEEALQPRGNFCLILPYMEGKQFCELATKRGFYIQRTTAVLTEENKEAVRLLIELKKESCLHSTSQLVLYKNRKQHIRTEEYKQLTGDFYLY